MAKIVDIKIDPKEPQALEAPMTRAKFEKLIETYKKQNPVKYGLKKAEFERKLAALK